MDIVPTVIWSLIYVALIVGLGYLIIWVLRELGIAFPPMVAKAIWVIVVLLCILVLYYMLVGIVGLPPHLRR